MSAAGTNTNTVNVLVPIDRRWNTKYLNMTSTSFQQQSTGCFRWQCSSCFALVKQAVSCTIFLQVYGPEDSCIHLGSLQRQEISREYIVLTERTYEQTLKWGWSSSQHAEAGLKGKHRNYSCFPPT